MTAPAWVTNVPSNPAVHNAPAPAYQWQNMSQAQLDQLRSNLIQSILQVVVQAVTGFLLPGNAITQLESWAQAIPGVSNLLAIIKQQTGVDLSTVFNGIDLTNPGSVVTAIGSSFQQIIDVLFTGVTGTAATGNDPLSLGLALLNQTAQVPGALLALLFGQQSTQQAQINAINSSGFSHNFASNGVTGWSNLVGTLALSTRGNYIQSATEVVAYRAGAASDKHGAHMVINPNMRGVARLGICSDTAAARWAGLEVYTGFAGDSLRIVTAASPTLTVVQAQVDFTGVDRLTPSAGLDVRTDGVNQFTVMRNGSTLLTWTDSGGVVAHDSSHRNIVLTSNGFDRNEDGFYGSAINQVVGYAW